MENIFNHMTEATTVSWIVSEVSYILGSIYPTTFLKYGETY